MEDLSMLDNTSLQTSTPTNPHEIALQALCKQLLKSRLFKGFYLERRYVENIKGYRDVICLTKSEKSLNKILCDIRDKLLLFYSHQKPHVWIGITSGNLTGFAPLPPAVLDTCLWVELKDVAFGQYWFNIRSIRFRDNEIILKLKVQAVHDEEKEASNKIGCDKSKESLGKLTGSSENNLTTAENLANQVTFDDFILLLQQWRTSIKQTAYNFMAEDISKENIKGLLRFFGLLVASIITGAFVGVKFLGSFTLQFMFEFSRLTHALTPTILKIIEVFSKIIGGFFILLAMIWKDIVVNRIQSKHIALQINSPMYQRIQYEQQKRLTSSPRTEYFRNDRL